MQSCCENFAKNSTPRPRPRLSFDVSTTVILFGLGLCLGKPRAQDCRLNANSKTLQIKSTASRPETSVSKSQVCRDDTVWKVEDFVSRYLGTTLA